MVCLATPAAVYMAADSRYSPAPRELRNSARKLLSCGPAALCGLSGQLRFTRTDFDLQEDVAPNQITFELADFIERVESTNQELSAAGQFSDSLYRTLAPVWAEFAVKLDRPFGATVSACKGKLMRLAELLYASCGASGRVLVETITLRHSMHGSKAGEYRSVLEAPEIRRLFEGRVKSGRFYLRGKKSCAHAEPLTGVIRSDDEALYALHSVFRSTQRNHRCASAIGGPVDVAAIGEFGLRWLRRKGGVLERAEAGCV